MQSATFRCHRCLNMPSIFKPDDQKSLRVKESNGRIVNQNLSARLPQSLWLRTTKNRWRRSWRRLSGSTTKRLQKHKRRIFILNWNSFKNIMHHIFSAKASSRTTYWKTSCARLTAPWRRRTLTTSWRRWTRTAQEPWTLTSSKRWWWASQRRERETIHILFMFLNVCLWQALSTWFQIIITRFKTESFKYPERLIAVAMRYAEFNITRSNKCGHLRMSGSTSLRGDLDI